MSVHFVSTIAAIEGHASSVVKASTRSMVRFMMCSVHCLRSRHSHLVEVSAAFFPFLLLLGPDRQVMKFFCIQGAQRRDECVVSPVVRTVEKS